MDIDRDDWFMAAGTRKPGFALPARRVKVCQACTKRPDEGSFACFALTLWLLFFIGCGKVELRPVELLPEDICGFCKMAISEKRYASELITQDGEVFKFDDIGCMLRFRKERSHVESAATFVADFDTREWLKSEKAYFVKSKEFKTPMGGNLAAFQTSGSAAAAADRTQGVSLRYATLLQQ